jgi:two-component system, response regulator
VILLVEDNEDDELLTLRALKKHRIGNEVIVARDGAQALDMLLGTRGATPLDPLPQLLLLDLNLPKVGGLEVLERLRADERTKMLPVVVFTSSKEDEDVLASYRNGANAYVRKPVDFAEFSKAVETVGLFWLLVNQGPPDPRPVP